MRGYLVLTIFAVVILLALRRPFVGVLTFYWISVMNPHRYVWGFVQDAPLAMVSALVTLVGLLLHWKEAKFPACFESKMFLLMWAYVTLTTTFAIYPDVAWNIWNLNSKIFLMIVVPMMLITTRRRLTWFLFALVTFVGFVGVKGAAFGIRTGGEHRVWGPPNSFLADNNAVALALVMMTPFCFLLKDLLPRRWQRWALVGVGWAMVISAILTYSRGGFLGLVAIGFLILLTARRRFTIALVAAVVVIVGFQFLPDQWTDRMSSIREFDEDRSANMRLNSWMLAYNMALDRPLGGGFGCYTMEQYYAYAPDPELGRTSTGGASVAHSSYFEILASHGFGGLAIFLVTILSMLRSLRKVDRVGRDRGDPWIRIMSRALAISIVGFLVNGAFMSKAFFDLFWAVFCAAVCLKAHVGSGAWLVESGVNTGPVVGDGSRSRELVTPAPKRPSKVSPGTVADPAQGSAMTKS